MGWGQIPGRIRVLPIGDRHFAFIQPERNPASGPGPSFGLKHYEVNGSIVVDNLFPVLFDLVLSVHFLVELRGVQTPNGK